jgi:general secretion pathway protein A
MYNEFFGLTRSPFELSPDPFFIFPTERNREALGSIYSAICRRKGFVVLTGEVGTGKTLVVRCLFELWKRQRISFVNMIGPRSTALDLLRFITFDLGIKVTEPTQGALLLALYTFLLSQLEKGLTTVLVIDEAHQMPTALLEEIRLLTNFETSQEKLLQVVLVGQPELDERLDSYELRQLKQRISIREQSLIAAYARQVAVVPVEIIDRVAAYFRLQVGTHEKPTEAILRLGEYPSSLDPDPQESQPADANANDLFTAQPQQQL